MKLNRAQKRNKRRLSKKSKIRGTSEKPRLAIFRSNANLYAQIIDDVKGVTLCSASSLDTEIGMRGKANRTVASKIGEVIGKRAVSANVQKIVFDKSGYAYHGVIQELADAARKTGLIF